MPPEQEDARARQIEALRRYVAQLGTQQERATELDVQQDHPNSEPTGPRSAPLCPRPALQLTGLLVALALLGGVVVGAVAWSNDRPFRRQPGRRDVVGDAAPLDRRRRPSSSSAMIYMLRGFGPCSLRSRFLRWRSQACARSTSW